MIYYDSPIHIGVGHSFGTYFLYIYVDDRDKARFKSTRPRKGHSEEESPHRERLQNLVVASMKNVNVLLMHK